MKKRSLKEYLKEEKKGIIATGAVVVGVGAALFIGFKGPEYLGKNSTEVTAEDNNIDFEDTEDIEIVKLTNKKTNDSRYYMVKEEELLRWTWVDVAYNFVDIVTDEVVLKLDEKGENIEGSMLGYEKLGTLSEYLVTSDNLKPKYTIGELETFLDTLVKEKLNATNKELIK